MSHFGWKNWKRFHSSQVNGRLPHGREREVLKYLHRKSSLNVLANRIKKQLPSKSVFVQSIWIDGTPQATFTDSAGKIGNCELADLLLIVREELPNGNLVSERGLLVQAKITPKYNKLTSGKSTVLERRLLERINRDEPLELHRDTTRSGLIGRYILGKNESNTEGLKDCARYLLAPKGEDWGCPFCFSPYQIGWPRNKLSSFLKNTRGFVDAVLSVGVTKNLGRQVCQSNIDEWSRLVNDLRGLYNSKLMNGYSHSRVNIGSALVSTSLHLWKDGKFLSPPRYLSFVDDEVIPERQPEISMIIVTLIGD